MALNNKNILVRWINQEIVENPLTQEDLDKIRDAKYVEFVGQLMKEMGSPELNMAHMAMGICGEAGELLDAVKKYWIYGKPLDVTNVIEELGDLEFYMAGMRLLCGLTRSQVLLENRAKLEVRYNGTYSDEAAQVRADKESEVPLQIIDMSKSNLDQTVSEVLALARQDKSQ